MEEALKGRVEEAGVAVVIESIANLEEIAREMRRKLRAHSGGV